LGCTYELIEEGDILSTNFSDYEMILIGEEDLEDVPFNEYKSLIASADYYETWSKWIGSTGSSQPLKANNTNVQIPITDELHGEFQVYTRAEENGITIPFPQRVVYMQNQEK